MQLSNPIPDSAAGFGRRRPTAVAGMFYPAQAAALRAEVESFLAQGESATAVPKALIVPHAGYIYSGAMAGRAYAQLAAGRGRIRRVVLLGPAHRVAFDGLGLPTVDVFDSPLGPVPIDQEALHEISDLPGVVANDFLHAQEHALEVQLPFLQVVLGSFKLVPVVVGRVAPADVAALLEVLWGGDETLIVISSDLSHYLPYSAAVAHDQASLGQVLAGGPDLRHEQACGAIPINGLLRVAAGRQLKARLIAACNSGDTAGDRSRVVGYAAMRFDPELA